MKNIRTGIHSHGRAYYDFMKLKMIDQHSCKLERYKIRSIYKMRAIGSINKKRMYLPLSTSNPLGLDCE